MASVLLAFLERLGPQASRTSTSANSWAVICLWRRFLAMNQEPDDETTAAVIHMAVKEKTDDILDKDLAQQSQQQYYHQRITTTTANNNNNNNFIMRNEIAQMMENQQLNNPDLCIDAMHRAQ